ncbi:MAG: peroxiredoxin-like family protein [Ramlibacter sp.]
MSAGRDNGPGETLVPRLRAMLDERPDWYRAILTRLAARLDRAAVPGALGVGDHMPDFVVPDGADDLVVSADLRARGPLVVCFVRGGWCPFCSATLSALDLILQRIEAAGGAMLALTPDTLGHGAAMQARLGLRFKVLSDVDCGVALQFGTAYRVPAEYNDALLHFGIDLSSRLGDGPGLLSMPATFVSDRAGVIRFAHVSGDITERAEPAVVSALVEALSAAGP